ncbi:peptide chain release factor N(5)-glutamine methyltransferase [uncultured Lacinutrix sp.]|uniref:peptide chain release factor N(5)-glutamine methyltransferase n=1 Tax=uncultured Lacinutrix sp. TaxID=574032 RepID=UPI002624C5F6|nr:peptide chain release factor N(5)-glutamine methyltransferase [uncultured Lacinutrix sp.]
MLLKDLQNIFHKELDVIYAKEEVASFFYMLVESFYNISRLQLALDTGITITKVEQDIVFQALDELKREIPIQYIIGETEFYGLPFKVNTHTLIPRPETEELVALIVGNYKNIEKLNVIDIGTGSGCIAVSLAKNIENAKVYALDISEEALKIAKQNAELNAVDITFIENSILDSHDFEIDLVHKFDVIVSNPPYVRNLEKEEIKNNVLNNEPHLALFVDDNNPLIFYKAITEFAIEKLKPRGELYFEINEYLGNETKTLVESYGFNNVKVIKDMFGRDRMLIATKPK